MFESVFGYYCSLEGIKLMLLLFTEIKKIQLSAKEHFQKISSDHEKLKSQLETHKKELELRGVELEKREALNETERKKLAEELEQVLCFILYFHFCLFTSLSFILRCSRWNYCFIFCSYDHFGIDAIGTHNTGVEFLLLQQCCPEINIFVPCWQSW